MPYKNRDNYRNYMRNYMKNQRKQYANLKKQVQREIDVYALQKQFPLAYQLLFGKKKRKK